MARSAVGRSQPWLASTRRRTSGPTASRIARTRATSSATGCAAVLILKIRWPRATFSRASATSASPLATASDQDSGTRSRTRPPSRRCTGTPSARPLRSHSAISTAARAKGTALHAPGHFKPERLDLRGVAAAQPGDDVPLQRGGDRLRRLLAPGRAAEAGRLAPADQAVARLDPHEHEVHGRQGGERHVMGTRNRDIGQDQPDVGDDHVCEGRATARGGTARAGCCACGSCCFIDLTALPTRRRGRGRGAARGRRRSGRGRTGRGRARACRPAATR